MSGLRGVSQETRRRAEEALANHVWRRETRRLRRWNAQWQRWADEYDEAEGYE